jgi:hypothetical protein
VQEAWQGSELDVECGGELRSEYATGTTPSADPRRSVEDDGTFCYTFFQAVARKA